MIKISVNGNRSDIAGYISYYSCKEIAPLLEIDEKEIIYETAVVDYFSFGDIDFSTKVETIVTISDNYAQYIGEINDILAKYLSGFVTEFDIRYQIIDSNLIYSFKVAPRKCECGDECTCGDNCECDSEHHCHEGCHCEGEHECCCHDECDCNDEECHCHEENHECGCKEHHHSCYCDDE